MGRVTSKQTEGEIYKDDDGEHGENVVEQTNKQREVETYKDDDGEHGEDVAEPAHLATGLGVTRHPAPPTDLKFKRVFLIHLMYSRAVSCDSLCPWSPQMSDIRHPAES